jgi:hypothetical protein
LPARARARGRGSAGSGPTWAGFGPTLFICFSFSFIPRAKTIIEKCRKMYKNAKIVKLIFLGLLFSLVFNKNSFVIFSGNKKF